MIFHNFSGSLASNRGKSGLLGGLLASRASKGSGSLGKKKGLLGKVGKYAVAGLAAYGTYKLAKSMAKGLRREYDDDDCWEYSILRDRYECVCAAQCNVYVGSAVSISISMGLLALTTTLTVFFNRN